MNKNNFLENTYKNIPWITLIDSWKPWKNIWIIAITHWNEPVGLDIFHYLVKDFNILKNLNSWKIYLIANNIKAYQKYFESWDINKYRFIDDNMNRISNQEFKQGSYEFERFEELKSIFKEIDIALDIHSVSKWNDVIGLSDTKYLKNAREFFDVETLLVDDMWKTWAVIWEFLRESKEAYGIECGNHIDESWYQNWLRNILNFLHFFWCIEKSIEKTYFIPPIFQFIQEIPVKTDNFKFLRNFSWFTQLWENEVYALDYQEKLQNIFWSQIYLGLPAKLPKKWDGAWFLFRKLEKEISNSIDI